MTSLFGNIIAAWKLSKRAFYDYKKQIIILVVLGFASSMLEAIGVNALIPLFSFFFEDGRVGQDIISVSIQKIFSLIHLDFNLVTILILICVLFFFKAVVLFIAGYIKIRIKSDYEYQTRKSLFTGTLFASWPYLLKQKIGHLENVLTVDIHQSSLFLSTITKLIALITGSVVYFFVAVNISQTITALAVVFGTVYFFVFKPLINRSRRIAEERAGMNKEIARHVNETISGVKMVKAFSVEETMANRGNKLFSDLKKNEIKAYLTQDIATVLVQPASVIFISFIILFSFYRTSYNLGALAAIVYLIQRLFGSLQEFQSKAHILSSRAPFVQNVLSYQEKARDFKEELQEVGNEKLTLEEKIEFSNVSFSYESGKEAISDISFIVPKGSLLAMVGPSGSGKTTIFDLLLRFFSPALGEITADGVNAEKIDLRVWRKEIAYVSQEIFLTNDTVQNNIGLYDTKIKKEDIIAAAKKAHIYDFIKSLPNGFETVVGERGVLLSVGQRQRIAIARALARSPKILLLDEITSSLDPESEAGITETIKGLKGSITIIMIAHRMATIMDADNVILLDQGKIIERGSPVTLLKDKKSIMYTRYGQSDKI